jgi:NAD(P)H-hydrate epimerase
MVAARLLHAWGADVAVFLSRASVEVAGVPRHQLAILERLGIPIGDAAAAVRGFEAEVALDGILGYGLSAEPQGGAAALIRWANAGGAPVLALDVPSGLESSTGRVSDPTIRAAATLTLALPKRALRDISNGAYTGELYLADIGVPSSVYTRLGLDVGPILAKDDIVRLR